MAKLHRKEQFVNYLSEVAYNKDISEEERLFCLYLALLFDIERLAKLGISEKRSRDLSFFMICSSIHIYFEEVHFIKEEHNAS